jgi:hypothetical protein
MLSVASVMGGRTNNPWPKKGKLNTAAISMTRRAVACKRASLKCGCYHVPGERRRMRVRRQGEFNRQYVKPHLGVDFFFVLSGFIIMYAQGREIPRFARNDKT